MMHNVMAGIHGAGQASSAYRFLSNTMSITMIHDIREYRVKSIVLHSSFSESSANEDKHAHWRLFLEIAQWPYYLEFNLEKISLNGDTMLDITECPYSAFHSQPVIGLFYIPITCPTLRVRNVIDLVSENGLDRYQLSRRGDGCRFWCQTVLDDLMVARWVPEDATVCVGQHIMSLHQQYGRVVIPYPAYQGRFS
ncbi:hypothetical protein FPV67DRAFT_1505963 [Lyophyllum atratum]|nr:hypothetical protein FPV67DRAFT_1505963 [Lyophyllum atratum]